MNFIKGFKFLKTHHSSKSHPSNEAAPAASICIFQFNLFNVQNQTAPAAGICLYSFALRANSPLTHLRFAQSHQYFVGAARRTTYFLHGASRRSHHIPKNSPAPNPRFLTV